MMEVHLKTRLFSFPTRSNPTLFINHQLQFLRNLPNWFDAASARTGDGTNSQCQRSCRICLKSSADAGLQGPSWRHAGPAEMVCVVVEGCITLARLTWPSYQSRVSDSVAAWRTACSCFSELGYIYTGHTGSCWEPAPACERSLRITTRLLR